MFKLSFIYFGKEIPGNLHVTYIKSSIAYAFAPSAETLPPDILRFNTPL